MPIRPENRARYPKDWKAISLRIRRERAEGRVALMPHWPARMGEDMAALYLGVSMTKFRERVKAGTYPAAGQGRRSAAMGKAPA
jgi:hypothetical protein